MGLALLLHESESPMIESPLTAHLNHAAADPNSWLLSSPMLGTSGFDRNIVSHAGQSPKPERPHTQYIGLRGGSELHGDCDLQEL